jgi:hypothetical protein
MSTGGRPYTPPHWVTGHISSEDAQFLGAVVEHVRPGAAVEIGVASGCSSAWMLTVMSSYQPADPGGRWLVSYDVATRCYFNPDYPVGAAVGDVCPELRERWVLRTGDALTARHELAGLGVTLPLAFIDAHHAHPWPTADLMALLPVLTPEAWVVLHDVRLPELNPQFQDFGALHLFREWPWERLEGDGERNIGAIRLPASRGDAADACRAILDLPWQVDLPRRIVDELQIQAEGAARATARHP